MSLIAQLKDSYRRLKKQTDYEWLYNVTAAELGAIMEDISELYADEYLSSIIPITIENHTIRRVTPIELSRLFLFALYDNNVPWVARWTMAEGMNWVVVALLVLSGSNVTLRPDTNAVEYESILDEFRLHTQECLNRKCIPYPLLKRVMQFGASVAWQRTRLYFLVGGSHVDDPGSPTDAQHGALL